MKRVAVGLGMWLVLGAAWAQQVWRCEVDGQVRFTDRPCEKSSQPLPARSLQPNVADSPASAPETVHVAPAASAASDAPASAPMAAVDTARPTDAGAAVSQQAVATHPRRTGRAHADGPWQRPAPQGLMQTDFVQRGYAPRRQNAASTPTP